MTIAFILERLGNGGAERVTASLATEFAVSYGYNVHVFTCVKEDDEYCLPNVVSRHIMKKGKNRFTTLVNKCAYLTRELDKIKPDVVFSLATPKTTIMLCFLSICRKFTLIVSERNDPNQYPNSRVLKYLRNFAYKIADGIVFQTPDAKEYFSKDIQKKGTIIPNPISPELIEPYTGIREKKIVNFCRLEPQKNLRLLIDAMIAIHKEFPDYILEIYGDGVQRKELENYCSQKGASEYIVFMGFENKIHEKIIEASLYVSSSNYEGISNSMLEAISLGIPTISTDCPIGGARMVIDDHKNGILVPIGDEKKLINSIREVLSDNELSNLLSRNGVKLRTKYSVDRIATKWDEFAREKRLHG